MRVNWRTMASLLAVLALLLAACGGGESASEEAPASEASGESSGETSEPAEGGGDLSGTVDVDGSSTVGPLTDAIAEEYASEAPDVQVNVGVSGTGGGFERFCGEGSTDISNASRPIKEEEAQLCEENGIEFTEIRVGTDALTMVTNPDTEFLSCLSTEELEKLWGEGVSTWNEINEQYPEDEVQIFAPDTDSGTYDFFTETIIGEEAQPIQDYNASADDNIIAQGVQGTPGSWGYFGFAYFVNNQEGLKALGYDAGEGCVDPSVENVQNDSYKLARPLFIYVKNSSVQDEEHVADFAEFYLDNVNSLISDVGYIEAPQEAIEESKQKIQTLISGEDPGTSGSSESAS